MKELIVELLENKEALWNEKKHGASECIEELSGHCSGSWVNTSIFIQFNCLLRSFPSNCFLIKFLKGFCCG